jgi:hypothetical protein
MFASDSLHGDVAGKDGIPEIAIGRLPVMTSAELTAAKNKIINYEQRAQDPWTKSILLLSDNTDMGGHFTEMTATITNMLPSDLDVETGSLEYSSASQLKAQLIAGVNEGRLFVNWFGHGGPDRLGNEGVLKSSDVGSLTNSTRLPVLTAMSCVVGRFEYPGTPCLGELLVNAANGGAIAVWAPSGLTYNNRSGILARGFYQAHYTLGYSVLGDVVLASMHHFASISGDQISLRLYNLLGDPALLIEGSSTGYASGYLSGFAQWKANQFSAAEQSQEDLSGMLADTDGDGMQNLLEYALNRNPKAGEDGHVFESLKSEKVGDASTLVLSYPRRKDASGLVYQIEMSTDLKTWFTDTTAVTEISASDNPDGVTEKVTVRITPPGGITPVFLRLRVISL